MFPVIWQAVLATCLSNFVYCGTISTLNAKSVHDSSVSCPARNFREPSYLPHPTDCQKYYICDEGFPVLRHCQQGLHFNPSIKACDYPEIAGCEKVSEKPEGRLIEDKDLDGCPRKNPKNPVLFPHPIYCDKFYICDSGTPHLKICQSGLHFNPKIKACDYPENAGCSEVVSEKPRGKIIEDGELDGCPKENSKDPVLFPHPTDCSKFYICDSGTPHLKTCQSELHFNPKIKACDFPEFAGCAEVISEKPRVKIIEDNELDGCPVKNSKDPVLFPHPTDCSKFYICDSGSPHLKTCQYGLHFNPKIKACDFPENAGCAEVVSEKPRDNIIEDGDFDGCPNNNSTRPIVFPHPTDCSMFYICYSGTPHLKTCQFGLHFNSKIKVCDFPENAGCAEVVSEKPRGKIIDHDELDGCPRENSKDPVLFPHPTDCNMFYICDNGTPHLKACQSGLHFNPKIKACDFPENAGCAEEKPRGKIIEDGELDGCPKENSRHPILFPHPTDCSKFYICDNGTPHLKTCQFGLHFNSKIKACDFPEKAACAEVVPEKPRGKIIEDGDLDGCPRENSKDPVLFPHPTDCNMYYICDNGTPHLKTCQSGLHFNPKIKACDFPENAGCAEVVSEKPRGKIFEDDELDGCPEMNPKDPILFPHPTDCSKFYICDSGTPHLKTCQSGLHFNSKIKACDYPDIAGCAEVVSEKPRGKIFEDDELDGCPKMNPKDPVLFPHPTDCSKFYICDSGTPHLKTCQSGLHFNSKIKACDYPDIAGCAEVVPEKPRGKIIEDGDLDGCPKENSKDPVLFPHPTDCNKFYICDNGTPHLKTCPYGLQFNPKIKACDFPENAGCTEGFTVKPKGKIIDDDINICPDESFQFPVFIRHPSDCKKFYICDSGSLHLQTCQSGLHFNHKLKVCDFPKDANCDEGASIKPRIKSEDESLLVSCPMKNPSDKPILLPHPTECEKYFMCDNGIPLVKDCQPGLNFNTKIQACDYAENNICFKEKSTVKVGFPSPFCPSVNGRTPIFYRHPSNCSVYYMCSHGLAYEFVCPARLHFNLREKVCDYENRARCVVKLLGGSE